MLTVVLLVGLVVLGIVLWVAWLNLDHHLVAQADLRELLVECLVVALVFLVLPIVAMAVLVALVLAVLG